MRIIVVARRITRVLDEGIHNTAFQLIKAFGKNHDVLGISISGEEIPEYNIALMPTNKFFVSMGMWRKIKEFSPDLIIYVPWSSCNYTRFFRAKLLSFYGRCKVALLTLQTREFKWGARLFAKFFRPDIVFTQSFDAVEKLRKMNIPAEFLPSGVDLEKFKPVSSDRKVKLREKYGIPADKYVCLHVGHLRKERNVLALGMLQEQLGDSFQMVAVGSTSTVIEESVVSSLKKAGAIVVDEYIENIEEIYQLADCYIFPVTRARASIEVPLSILEAMACNLPVVTTRYGGIFGIFEEGEGLFFADTLDEFVVAIQKAMEIKEVNTRAKCEKFSWDGIARRIIQCVKAL